MPPQWRSIVGGCFRLLPYSCIDRNSLPCNGDFFSFISAISPIFLDFQYRSQKPSECF